MPGWKMTGTQTYLEPEGWGWGAGKTPPLHPLPLPWCHCPLRQIRTLSFREARAAQGHSSFPGPWSSESCLLSPATQELLPCPWGKQAT